jgi:uncharacterized protein DUF5076
MSRQLSVPSKVLDDPRWSEILRVWTDGNVQQFMIRPTVWGDPAAWGLLLVDLANQVAAAYVHQQGGDTDTIRARIRSGFDAEWETPTDT